MAVIFPSQRVFKFCHAQQSVPDPEERRAGEHRDNAPDPSIGSRQAVWESARFTGIFWLRVFSASEDWPCQYSEEHRTFPKVRGQDIIHWAAVARCRELIKKWQLNVATLRALVTIARAMARQGGSLYHSQ